MKKSNKNIRGKKPNKKLKNTRIEILTCAKQFLAITI